MTTSRLLGSRFKATALLLAAGALSLAAIACDDASGVDEGGDETPVATTTPDSDGTSVEGTDPNNRETSRPGGSAPGGSVSNPATTPPSPGEGPSRGPASGGGVSGSPGEGNTGSPVQPAPGTPPGTGPDAPVSSDDPPAPTPTEDPGLADGSRVVELAPIESAEVRFAESYPVQHFLHIVSGLPSGCAAFAGTEVERTGTVFTVTVTNTMPAPDQEIACTMIYGYHDSNVALGSDLESGMEYTVHINDVTMTFVAQ